MRDPDYRALISQRERPTFRKQGKFFNTYVSYDIIDQKAICILKLQGGNTKQLLHIGIIEYFHFYPP